MTKDHKPVLCQQRNPSYNPYDKTKRIPTWWEITAERINNSIRSFRKGGQTTDELVAELEDHLMTCWSGHFNAMLRSPNRAALPRSNTPMFTKTDTGIMLHQDLRLLLSEDELRMRLRAVARDLENSDDDAATCNHALYTTLFFMGEQLAFYQALDFTYGLNTKWN